MDVLEISQALLRYITRDKNTLYVFSPNGIGDLLIVGGFCYAMLKKKRKQSCVLITYDRFADSGINFVGVSEIKYIPKTLAQNLWQYIYKTEYYESDNYVNGFFKRKPGTDNDYIWNENLCFVDRYKEYFGLSLGTELLPPLIDTLTDAQKQRLHENYTLDKKRTIILAPHANTMPKLDESFWAELVAELKHKNSDYVLYTNVATPAEKVIPGTAPITTTFPELMYVAENVNCFIGLRSGLFDLLAFTNARFLYINRNFDWKHHDLDINFNHTNSRAFYMTEGYGAYIRVIMKQNNIRSIDELKFFNRIEGRNVAFDAESLLKKIVDSVD